MKNHIRLLLLFAAFLFCAVATFSQKNTLYWSVVPNRYIYDSGNGVLFQRNLGRLDAYFSVASIKHYRIDENAFNTIRFASGAIKRVKYSRDFQNQFALGLNYSKILSFDIGTGVVVKRVAILVFYDPLQHISSINLGYNF
jgi:hypothetical protein